MRDFVLLKMLRFNGIVIISWMLTLYTKCVQPEMDNPSLNLHLQTWVCCPKKQMVALYWSSSDSNSQYLGIF